MMDDYFLLTGACNDFSFPNILYNIYKKSISGILIIKTDVWEKRISVRDRKVIFASSTAESDSFGNYLLRNKIINRNTHQNTLEYMKKNNKKFGRSLIEQDYFDYDRLWIWIPRHLKEIVLSLFSNTQGKYEIITDNEENHENIALDTGILSIIVEGVRQLDDVTEFFDWQGDISKLYIGSTELLKKIDLKPFERHILNLINLEADFKEIIERSELLETDTIKVIYLLLLLEIITPEESKNSSEEKHHENIFRSSSFTSFESALRHYNEKYELIFKALSKEIGPIALSILTKAVEDVSNNLPSFLKKVQINSTGSLSEEIILKTLWFCDFQKNIHPFLRGLEEILYAEIYAVKKHLGVDYEQQILKWLNISGN